MRLCAMASSSCTLTLLLLSSSMFFCVCSSILAISRCFSEVSLPFSAPLPPARSTTAARGARRATGRDERLLETPGALQGPAQLLL